LHDRDGGVPGRLIPPLDLSRLTKAETDGLLLALGAPVPSLTARVAELEAWPNQPPTSA
jgi:hypothetical protein